MVPDCLGRAMGWVTIWLRVYPCFAVGPLLPRHRRTMYTDPAQPALAQYVLRLEGTLESLDERIATLALALGAQLDQAGQLDQWLQHVPDAARSPTRQGRQ